MKFSVEFANDFQYINEVDEIKIDFKPNYDRLLPFLIEYINKRIIIRVNFSDIEHLIIENDIERFFKLENRNFAFSLPPLNDENKKYLLLFGRELKKHNIDFFFRDYIYSIDSLWEYINFNVSDVYITGELGFEIPKISTVLKERGINLRVIPDIAQSSASQSDITNFFIRPEDLYLYENYIDIIEFYNNVNFHKRDELMYETYAINKEWPNKLNYLIEGIKEKTANYSIPREFGKTRLNCGKRCLKGSNCESCYVAIKLANCIENNGYILKKDKSFSNLDN